MPFLSGTFHTEQGLQYLPESIAAFQAGDDAYPGKERLS